MNSAAPERAAGADLRALAPAAMGNAAPGDRAMTISAIAPPPPPPTPGVGALAVPVAMPGATQLPVVDPPDDPAAPIPAVIGQRAGRARAAIGRAEASQAAVAPEAAASPVAALAAAVALAAVTSIAESALTPPLPPRQGGAGRG